MDVASITSVDCSQQQQQQRRLMRGRDGAGWRRYHLATRLLSRLAERPGRESETPGRCHRLELPTPVLLQQLNKRCDVRITMRSALGDVVANCRLTDANYVRTFTRYSYSCQNNDTLLFSATWRPSTLPRIVSRQSMNPSTLLTRFAAKMTIDISGYLWIIKMLCRMHASPQFPLKLASCNSRLAVSPIPLVFRGRFHRKF